MFARLVVAMTISGVLVFMPTKTSADEGSQKVWVTLRLIIGNGKKGAQIYTKDTSDNAVIKIFDVPEGGDPQHSVGWIDLALSAKLQVPYVVYCEKGGKNGNGVITSFSYSSVHAKNYGQAVVRCP